MLKLAKPDEEDHLKVQCNGRELTVEVAADGEGLVSRTGTALLTQVADETGLTRALWRAATLEAQAPRPLPAGNRV